MDEIISKIKQDLRLLMALALKMSRSNKERLKWKKQFMNLKQRAKQTQR